MLEAQVENPIPPSRRTPGAPADTSAFRFRPTTRVGVVLAVVISAATIWASSSFVRKTPPPAATLPGVTVDKAGVSIAANAPQWQVLALETAQAMASTWTDPVPALKRDAAAALVLLLDGQKADDVAPLLGTDQPRATSASNHCRTAGSKRSSTSLRATPRSKHVRAGPFVFPV